MNLKCAYHSCSYAIGTNTFPYCMRTTLCLRRAFGIPCLGMGCNNNNNNNTRYPNAPSGLNHSRGIPGNNRQAEQDRENSQLVTIPLAIRLNNAYRWPPKQCSARVMHSYPVDGASYLAFYPYSLPNGVVILSSCNPVHLSFDDHPIFPHSTCVILSLLAIWLVRPPRLRFKRKCNRREIVIIRESHWDSCIAFQME